MTRLRRTTHCPVPGHGTGCDLADECPPFYERSTEKRMALNFELDADELGGPGPSSRRRVVSAPTPSLPGTGSDREAGVRQAAD